MQKPDVHVLYEVCVCVCFLCRLKSFGSGVELGIVGTR